MEAALIVVRFVHFAAAMAAFGIGAFRLYAFAGGIEAEHATARAALDTELARATTVAASLALASALGMVPFVAAEMAGSAAASLDPTTWHAVLAHTQFGRDWCWHLVFGVALVALCVAPHTRGHAGFTTAAALLLLASLGWVGHAASDEGGGMTHVINQMVHLTASGLWLGGLLPLAVLLNRAVGASGANYVPLARIALPHFSQVGYAAVALVALTGTINSAFLVGSVHALALTPYGRLLTIKIVLFATMVGVALFNRFRLMPRLRDAASTAVPLRALLRSVVAEQAMGLAILAVVAVLGIWPPAIHAMMDMKMQ